jgi:hypothetical protein
MHGQEGLNPENRLIWVTAQERLGEYLLFKHQ